MKKPEAVGTHIGKVHGVAGRIVDGCPLALPSVQLLRLWTLVRAEHVLRGIRCPLGRLPPLVEQREFIPGAVCVTVRVARFGNALGGWLISKKETWTTLVHWASWAKLYEKVEPSESFQGRLKATGSPHRLLAFTQIEPFRAGVCVEWADKTQATYAAPLVHVVGWLEDAL